MPKPRTPSNVLELRGSFRKDPQRRRADAAGAAPFDPTPPPGLDESAVMAWHWLVVRLPVAQWFSIDEVSVEVCARLLAKYRASGDDNVARELRAWLGAAGLTPTARLKLAPIATDGTPSKFAKYKAKVYQAQQSRPASTPDTALEVTHG